MTIPAGGGGWVPKSDRGKKVLKWTVWGATPVVLAVGIWIGVTYGMR